jgi:hypothetical protein
MSNSKNNESKISSDNSNKSNNISNKKNLNSKSEISYISSSTSVTSPTYPKKYNPNKDVLNEATQDANSQKSTSNKNEHIDSKMPTTVKMQAENTLIKSISPNEYKMSQQNLQAHPSSSSIAMIKSTLLASANVANTHELKSSAKLATSSSSSTSSSPKNMSTDQFPKQQDKLQNNKDSKILNSKNLNIE